MDDEARKKAELARQIAKDDFMFVASDIRGQRVIRRILENAGIFNLSFAGENSHTTAFNEGRRNVGLYVNSEIVRHCPDKWVNIMKANE